MDHTGKITGISIRFRKLMSNLYQLHWKFGGPAKESTLCCGTFDVDWPAYVGDSCRCPGPWFNIKMSSYQYRKSHCGDKTVVRSSYLHNGISYTGKMSSLYWIRALVPNRPSATTIQTTMAQCMVHDDVMIWKRLPHYWTFVWESIGHWTIPEKGQLCRALMFLV